MPRLTREQRRMRRLDRLENIAFWLIVFGGSALMVLIIGTLA